MSKYLLDLTRENIKRLEPVVASLKQKADKARITMNQLLDKREAADALGLSGAELDDITQRSIEARLEYNRLQSSYEDKLFTLNKVKASEERLSCELDADSDYKSFLRGLNNV